MKKRVWDIVPVIIAFVLLICILAVIVSIMQQQKILPASSTPVRPISNENSNSENETDAPPTITPYYTTLPKLPDTDDFFLFSQTLEGHGDIHIKNIHNTVFGTFAIVEADTSFGDIAVENISVGIAKISNLGSIEKIFILPSYQDLNFISSQITENGIAIMCYNQQNTLLFCIDYDLDSLTTSSLPLAKKGRIFSGLQDLIILTQANQNNIYKYIDDELRTAFLPSGDIIEVYDFYNYLLIIINQQSGYCIVKLSPQLRKLQQTYIQDSSIKAIVPYTDNNQQYFIVAEEKGGNTAIVKYDINFTTTEQSTDIGKINNLVLIPYNNKITAIFSGNTKGIYSFDNNLNCTLLDVSILQNIDTIWGYNIMNDIYYLVCNIDKHLVLLSCAFDDSYSQTVIDDTTTSQAFLIKNTNSTLCIYYQKLDEYGYNYIKIICHNF